MVPKHASETTKSELPRLRALQIDGDDVIVESATIFCNDDGGQ